MNNAAPRLASSSRPLDAWLLVAATDALARAAERGSCLLRVHAPAVDCEPRRLARLDEVAFVLDDPWSGLALAGIGAEPDGAAGEASRWSSRERELAVEHAAPGLGIRPLPAVCAAFPFDDGATAAGPWAQWSRSVVRVPSIIAWSLPRGEAAGVIVQVRVTPGGDPVALADLVAARLDDALRRAARASGVRAVWTRGAACPDLLSDPSETREAWCARVERGLRAIEAGEMRKVVPARSVRFRPPDGYRFDPGATLDALRRRNPAALCFAVSEPWGCFLGASPELLLRVDGDRVESRPLAGTAPRGADPEGDEALAHALLASAKDRREHRLVVDGIREALEPVCRDVEVPGGPHVVRLPSLLHLETQIRGRLAAGGALDVLARLHPTAAIAGTPPAAAVAWLRREERAARGLFGGAVGWLGQDAATFALGIRAALVTPDDAVAWAGAGIVRGSGPEAEWRETELKLGVVREALAVRRRR